MKKLSQEEITDKLHQDHFPRGPELERLSDPLTRHAYAGHAGAVAALRTQPALHP